MRCPVTGFDCITCEGKCTLGAPWAPHFHEPIYEDGAGYICRVCGEEVDDDDD
jgi:hypothetical protein